MVQVGFVSCNKDDDDDEVSTADLKTALIGSWKKVSHVSYVDGKESTDFSQYYDDDDYYVEVFNSDGTFSGYGVVDGKKDEEGDSWRLINGKWQLDGDKLKYDVDDEYHFYDECIYIVSIKDNTLTLTRDENSELFFDEEEGVYFDAGDGEGTKVNFKSVETFKKL